MARSGAIRMKNSVRLIDPELSLDLEQATEVELRIIVLNVCYFVLKENNLLSEPTVIAAVEAIHDLTYGDQVLTQNLELLVETLDETQWNVSEDVETGTAEYADYASAFRRARAANALLVALNSDSLLATTNSIYEAHAATTEYDKLREIILNILGN